jgi:hypothetical protein
MMLELPRPVPEYPDAPDFPRLRDAFTQAVIKGGDGRTAYQAWSAAYAQHVREYAEIDARVDAEHVRIRDLYGEIVKKAGGLRELARRVGGDVNMGATGTSSRFYTATEHEEAVTAWRALVSEYLGEDASGYELDAHVPLPYYRPVSRVPDTTAKPQPYSDAVSAVLNASMTTNA